MDAGRFCILNQVNTKAVSVYFSTDTSHYENVPFEVPEGWCWCRLDDLCTFLSRGKSPVYSDTDRRYPVFAQKCNLKDGGISLEKAQFLDPTTLKRWPEIYHLRTGDVLVNSTGTGTVGRTRLFDDSCLGKYAFVVPDSHVSVIRTHVDIVSEYIYALMSSTWIQTYMEDNLAGSTNQKELYIGVLQNMDVPLPPINEQSRIAAKLIDLERIISVFEKSESALSVSITTAKSKILDLAIHGKLVPQDPKDEPASELLKRINPKAIITGDNPHYIHEYQIPNNWAWTTLGAIGKWQSGGTPSRMHKEYYGGHIPWLKTGDLNDGIITEIPERITELGIENSSAKLNPVGSILIAMYGATIGKVGILGIPATTNQACCACVDYNGIIQKYLFYFLLSHKEEFIALGGGGAQPNISKEIITKTPIPIPPMEEQLRIVEKIEKLYSQLDMIKESLQA